MLTGLIVYAFSYFHTSDWFPQKEQTKSFEISAKKNKNENKTNGQKDKNKFRKEQTAGQTW